MAKQYKVLVNTGKTENNKAVDVQQFSGDKGQPVRIKAQAGAKYQLQESTRGKNVGPDYIKTKRVGKNLHIIFEDETQASLIIEDYYGETPAGYNGVIGQAENGKFYEYIPEDPRVPGLIPELAEGGQAVNVALGGAEVLPAGAAVAVAAFPLLGALGLLGAAGAAAYLGNQNTTNNGVTGALTNTAPNDSGVLGDNLTNDNTPQLSGTVPAGSTATVTINGQTYPVTVNPDGTWSFTNPTNLPDGTYYPVLNVTQNGVTKPYNLTPFTIDTTPPTIAITSSAAALATGEQATITFTLSEPSADFTDADIAVTGGTLSNLQKSATNPLVYTATFTPTAGSTPGTATISVASDKFADAAANRNTDGLEANNTVSLKTNATITGALTATAPNDSGTLGDNLTSDNTPNLSGKVPAGSTATVTLNGKTYPATVDSSGKWTAQIPDTDKLPDGTYTPVLNVTTGGVTTSTPITPFTIDTVPPSVLVTSSASTLVSGQTSNVTFTLSEPVSDFSAADVTVTGGTLSNFAQSATDPKVYTATFTPASTGTSASIKVDSGKFSDAAANFNTDGADTSATTTNIVNLATNAAASGQLAAVSDNTTGVPNDNKTNDATPELSGKVPAGSSATVTINGQTYPVTVAPDGSWTFTQPTNLPDGTYTPVLNVTTNGQTSSVPITPFTIDTVPPTVVVTGANTAALSAGQSTTITFTLSEATTNLTDADIAVAGGTLGLLQQSATNPLVYTATFTATPGTTANTTASVSVASDKFSDAAGNLNKDGADTSPTTTNIWSSTVTPANNGSLKTALSIDPITGDNVIFLNEQGATSVTVTGKVTGTFVAGDVVTLTLNGKAYTALAAADGSYSVAVAMADLKQDADTKIDGTVTGTGGSAATAAQDYTVEAGNTATQTALSIDKVTADNIIGSTESTGTIAITGKVTGKYAAGDIVTLTVNGKTFTGTAAADGSYSIAVPAADLLADSDTMVDGSVTGTGGTLAKAVQDYGVDANTNPPSVKTALSIDPITGDNVLLLSEQGATSVTVTGKVTGTFVAGDVVTLTLNGHTYTALAAADGSYSVAVAMADLKQDADTKIEGTVTGTGGQYATAAQDYTVEATNTVTQTALSIDKVTADNIIGSSESTGNIAITGKVTGKFVAGDTVTLTINNKTFTGTAAADGSYSIAVPAADLLADSDTQVDGTVTGTGGTLANAIQNYGVDPNINPVPPASVKTALSIDPITGDNVLLLSEQGATSYTVTGKVTGTFVAGDLVTLTLNGHTYTALAAADGSYSVAVTMADLKADSDTKIDGSVTGTGGQYATAAQDYTVEATNTATQTALSINAVTADNIIGRTESTGTIAITGKVTGKFVAGDTVTLTVNGHDYTGQAAADGSYSISVPASDLTADADTKVDGTVTGTGGTTATAFQDYGVDASVNPAQVDTIPPTIVVARTNSATTTLDANGKETLVFTLSEASTTFDASDIVVFNGSGTITGFAAVPTSGTAATGYTQYTAIFTPTAGTNGTANIGVASGKFADNAGNLNQDTYLAPAPTGATTEANNSVSVAYDTRNTNPIDNDPPNIQVSIDKTTLASGQTGTLSFILSEASTTFTLSDITVISGGGTVSNLQAVPGSNGTQYTATYTAGAAAGTVLIGVAESTFADAAGNLNTDTYKGSATGTTAVTATTAEANNWVQLTTTGSVDAMPPTVIVSRTGTGTVGAAGEAIVFTFSEGVATTSFTLSDIDATNGAMSNLVPVESSKTATGVYTQYTATYTPATGSAGTGSIGVAAGKFADAAGNNNLDTYNASADTVTGHIVETNNQVALAYDTTTVDTTPPKIAITADKTTLAAGQTATITFTLSEASTDFAQTDVITTGGSLSNWTRVNATTYTATYTATPGGQSTGSVHVDSNAFSDAALNYNQDGADANNTVDFITNNGTDLTPPKIAISSNQASLTTGQTATITFTVSEATTDFTWNGSTGDIVVTGGTLGALTHVGVNAAGEDIYTAVFTPTANSTTPATIAVAAGQFHDAAGNQNLDTYAAATAHITGETAETNNIVTLTVNTQGSVASLNLTSDKATALEAGGAYSATGGATPGTNPFAVATSGVLSNDTGTSPTVTGIQKISDTSATAVAASTTSGTGTSIVGQYGTLKIGADGSYTYTVNNTDAAVQALRTSANTVTDVFTYTATDASGSKTANLVVTVQGANDAPTIAVAVADKTLTLGTALTPFSIVNNFADVDSAANGETATYSAALTGGGAWPTWLSFDPVTGTFSGTPPTAGVTSIDVTRRDLLGLSVTDTFLITVTPVVDTTPPKIAITSNQASLTTGQTATITFTISEATTDFTATDIDVTGGTLGPLTHVGVNAAGEDIYTAVFTPTTNSTTPATIAVAAGKFHDAAATPNQNLDTYSTATTHVTGEAIETNNIVTLSVNTTTAASALALSTDTATAVEAGGAYSATGGATVGVDPNGNVLTNDVGNTPTVTGIQKFSDTNATAVTTGTTSGTGTSIVGQYGTLKIGADGSYVYTVDNLNPTVQALRTTANTVNEVFTYTANDGTGAKTATLVVTVQGANDAPTVVVQEADKTLTAGTALTPFSILNNFADVDSGANGETATYSAALTNGGTWPTWLSFDPVTGTFSGTPPTAGVTSINVTRRDAAGLTATDTFLITVTPVVDTTPPKIAITSDQSSLLTGQTATITFTISEATNDFAWDGTTGDIVVTGGSLSALTHVGVNAAGEDIYTAIFVPTANSTTPGAISVAAGKFHDTAATPNQNLDTWSASADSVTGHIVEANNIVNLTINTTTAAASLNLTSDKATAVEAGGVANGIPGTDLAVAAASGVLSNDSGATPTVTGIQKLSDTSATSVAAGTTGGSGTVMVGQYGTLKMGADGSYVYTVDNANTTVQALRTSANTVTDVFTYTATDASGTKTANLVVTVQGANDAPTVVVQEADKTLTVGTALTPFSVLNNFADVDSGANGETATYSAALTGGGAWPSWLTFDAATGTFSGTPPTAGVTSIDVTRRDLLGLSVTDTFLITVTPAVDTTPPKIAITSNQASLTSGQTATITFTISEATSDFTAIDIDVTGGTLGTLTHVGVNAAGEDIYTAVFTPATNSTTAATIGVAAGKFHDAAATPNQNLDTYSTTADSVTGHLVEANNLVTLSVNTTVVTALNLANDTATAVEAGGVVNGSPGTNSTANVLGNDTGASTLVVTGVQLLSAGSASAVSAGTTSSTGTPLVGQYGTLTMGADGSYVYTVANGNAAVQALRTSANTLTEVFTYTATDGAGSKTANLVVTVQGANDAPTVVVQEADKTATVGNALAPFSILSNFDDVDSAANGETATYTATATGGALGSWLVFNAATGTFTGTPTAAGTTSVTVTRTDKDGLAVSDTFDIVTTLPVITTTVSFSSMTKDSGTALNANWTTNDASAGRLLSGDISAPLATGEVVKVYANGSLVGTAVVNGTKWEITDLNGYNANWTYTAQVVGAGNNLGPISASRVVTFASTDDATATVSGTSGADTSSYTTGVFDALAGDDTITATSTALQTTLAAGGIINGGAGLDTLMLAAGTTLNLGTLTHNQTVRAIEQVEIITMQGSSSVLSMTANDVLSLGATNTGSLVANNTSTMAPYSFASTTQNAIGTGASAIAATGSTSSAGKVQMVINGAAGDTLNLAALATDGVTTAGAEGNTGLAGVWDYKGEVLIGSTTYRVYDHSTTKAQVLVNVDVQVTPVLPVPPALALLNDTASATEAGGVTNAIAGSSASGNVLTNDQGASPQVTGVQLVSATSATAVASGTTSSTGTTLTGQYGTLYMGADGSYTYNVDNGNATVQALRTASNTLSEVFTYTANDGTGAKTANLVVTIKGANDAPTVVVQEADKTGAVGTAINSFSILNNFADVDSTANGETATYTASPLPAGITFNAATGTFSGTPTAAGTTSITVTRTDAAGLSVSDTFDFVVADVITKTVAFSTMTKDSGTVTGVNQNWVTSDASAGRLVSGTISAALSTNEVVKVYANGAEIGSARVVGTAWEITDLNGYASNPSWTYTAKVVNTSSNSAGAVATQVVNTDFTVDAPVITGVFDSAVAGATTVANNGSTTSPLDSVSGTASPNALIYLYDNTSTNLVGTAVADATGNWTVSGFGVLPTSNTFSAKQVDVHGNESGLSNLWTVTTTASGGFNGNFDNGDVTGFATDMTWLPAGTTFNYVRQRFGFNVIDKPIAYDTNNNPQTVLATLTPSAATTWNGVDTWSEKIYAPGAAVAFEETEKGWNTFLSLASGKIFVGSMDAYGGMGQMATIWGSQVNVVKGQTYQFSFDYWNTIFGTGTTNTAADRTFIHALINGTEAMVTHNASTGSVTINYTATTTGPISLKLGATGWNNGGDFALDNISFAAVAPANGSLVPGAHPGFTSGVDGSSASPVAYTGGAVDAQGGNDTIGVAAGVNLQTALATGGSYINGGAGVDTLVLNAGTTLNLNALTTNQTVQAIQQVEIFKLQGTSTLTLSANDVLSLGGSNATTMAGYNFTGNTGKVQLVVDATASDTLNLTALATDAVTTNGVLGNTGLAGTWVDAGTVSIGSASYHVYNHSTTDAQVLVAGGATVNPNGGGTTQAVVITKVENTGEGAVYKEEFNSGTTTVAANLNSATSAPTYTTSTAINTAGSKISTGAWDISTVDVWWSWNYNQSYAPVNELYLKTGATTPASATATAADTLLGTDGKLQLGLDANEGTPGGANDARLYTFTSKTGPFTAISFKSFGLDNRVSGSAPTIWNYPQVEFYDAQGNVVYRTDFKTLSLTTQLDNFNVTLPAGVTASSFGFRTLNADRWFIDELSMTSAANEIVPHLGTTADTTHKISGTYASNLNAGEVIKIYDATGTVYLGDAVVDPATKTWTFESPTPAAVGTHPYVAKIESASAVVATSNTYTVNLLGAGQLDITAISTDSDTAGDFVTTDNTLIYSGALPQPLATGEKVLVQIYAADGTTLVRSSAVSPAAGSTTWTWDNSAAAALADGNYVIKATIVAADGVTAVTSYGARGTDVQPMTIISTPPSQTVAFSSMTKDSGAANDWITSDASAGRLVSGTVSAALTSDQVVEVYANGVKIGNAVVNGTAWEITDTNGYTGNWTYTAKVSYAVGIGGQVATQAVTTDFTAGSILISDVKTTDGITVANNGTTTKALGSVSGTAAPLAKVYLYDNSLGNLVGTATADASGNWTVSGLNISVTSNTFVAKHTDTAGNESALSNLWQVGTTKSAVQNGDFELGLAGFGDARPADGQYWGSHTPLYSAATTVADIWVGGQRRMDVIAEPAAVGAVGALTANNGNEWMYGTWSENVYTSTSLADVKVAGFNAFLGLANGNFLAGHQDASGGSLSSLVTNEFVSDGRTPQSLYATEVNVVKGHKYAISFDYMSGGFKDLAGERDGIELFINGVKVMATKTYSAGHVSAEYTSPTDGQVTLSLQTYTMATGQHSIYALDNISFQEMPATNGTSGLSGSTGPTEMADTLTYTSGALSALGGNDKITVSTQSLQTLLGTGGGYINGGAGVDTLKLEAGTSLDLMTLTANQTVKPIQQVEVFELQGNSSLTITANDVLSLGGSNATTMAAYSFASTTQATYGTTSAAGSTSSTGKVQFVVNATSTDQVVLANLATDGVTTNATVGNTGLAGQWAYKGTTSLTVDGVTSTYRVYDHSTTQAQVLIDGDASSATQTGGTSGGTGSSSGGTGTGGTGGTSTTGTNGVMITSVQASGTTSKVMTETFDGLLQYENTPMRTFITDSGMEFHWANATATVNSGNFLLGDVNSGLNGQGRALHVNGAYLPGSANLLDQFEIFQQQGYLTRVEFDYWGLPNAQQQVFTDATLAGTDTSNITFLENTTPNHFVMDVNGASHLTDQGIFFTKMNLSDFYIDNVSFTLSGVNETVDVGNGGTTRYTTGTVKGTLASALASGQKVEVFSGATSMGFATVNGTEWSIADPSLSAGGEVYTAKIVNADNSVATSSGSYSINQAATATPKLTISDDATSTVVNAGTSINYTFSFDQAVTGFTASDVTVTGGTKGALTQIDSKTWVMTVTADTAGAGTMMVSVADGAYTNSAGTVAGLGSSHAQSFDPSAGIYKVEYFQRTTWGQITFTGTDKDDVMHAVGDTYFMGIVGGEKMYAGAGNDTVIIDNVNVDYLHYDYSGVTWDSFTRVNAVFDGGSGTDTLKLTGGTVALDLQNVNVQANLHGFEVFDLLPYNNELGLSDRTDAYNCTIKVNLAGIQAVSDTDVLTILGDGNDVVRISSSAYIQGTATLNGQAFKTFDLNSDGKIDLYVTSATWVVSVAAGTVTPLLLDLNGDGVQTTGVEKPVSFDIEGDSQVDSTAWASAADGFLAMDLNGDGQINSGLELFGEGFVMPDGSKAADGFAALATIDSNADGVVNASDAKFNDLRLWVDANSNGVTDAGELKTLADLGIASLNLNAKTSAQDNNGNFFGLVSSYTKQDGTQADLVDVWLAKSADQISPAAVELQAHDLLAQQGASLDLSRVLDITGVVGSGGQTVANTLKVTADDVLQLPTNASGQHVLQVQGDSNDAVNLSKVFTDGHAQGEWSASGTTTDNGHTYNVYQHSGDASLQVLIDQHIVQSNVHLS